jgi:hypothetical protein
MRNQAAAMGGYAHAMIKDLHGGRRITRFQLRTDQLIRNAVIMALDLDVIVDVGADLLPLGQNVALHG